MGCHGEVVGHDEQGIPMKIEDFIDISFQAISLDSPPGPWSGLGKLGVFETCRPNRVNI